MNHAKGAMAVDAILTNRNEFTTLEDHGYMWIDTTRLHGISRTLRKNIRFNRAVSPSRQVCHVDCEPISVLHVPFTF